MIRQNRGGIPVRLRGVMLPVQWWNKPPQQEVAHFITITLRRRIRAIPLIPASALPTGRNRGVQLLHACLGDVDLADS
jgi:hypothetical protein